MKVSINYRKYDENSTELKELKFLGFPVGFYSFGTFSKYQKFLMRNNLDIVANENVYAKRFYPNSLA